MHIFFWPKSVNQTTQHVFVVCCVNAVTMIIKSRIQFKNAVGGALLCAGLWAAPAYADTKPAQSEAVIIRPLSFIVFEDLNFGQIIASNTAGTVTLTPGGVRTATNGIALIGTEFSGARFAGQGRLNQIVTIALAANTIQITGPGNNRMRVRTFTIGSTPTVVLSTNPRRFRITGANGIFAFTVGATLEVGANQVPGLYTGNWDVTLEYQ